MRNIFKSDPLLGVSKENHTMQQTLVNLRNIFKNGMALHNISWDHQLIKVGRNEKVEQVESQ
jgi:hypothetical protein